LPLCSFFWSVRREKGIVRLGASCEWQQSGGALEVLEGRAGFGPVTLKLDGCTRPFHVAEHQLAATRLTLLDNVAFFEFGEALPAAAGAVRAPG
jgi:hypothetical protein